MGSVAAGVVLSPLTRPHGWAGRLGISPTVVEVALGVLVLGGGLLIQLWRAFICPKLTRDCVDCGSARALATVLVLCGVLCAVVLVPYLLMNGLDLKQMVQHPIRSGMAHPDTAYLVMAPFLAGLPLALLYGTVRGLQGLEDGLKYAVLWTMVTVVYVALHVLFEHVLGDPAAANFHAERHAAITTGVTTLVAVLLFEHAKERVEHQLHRLVLGPRGGRHAHSTRPSGEEEESPIPATIARHPAVPERPAPMNLAAFSR